MCGNLYKVVRKSLTDMVIFEQRCERSKEVRPAGICGKGCWAEGLASAKAPGRSMLGIFQE